MNKIAMTHSAAQQALWYLVVGASAALVHFLVLFSVVSLTTTTPAWANVCAFLIAFVISFLGHFYLTFRHSSLNKYDTTVLSQSHKSTTRQPRIHTSKANNTLKAAAKWFVSSVAGFAANQSLFVLGLGWFGERYYLVIWLIVTGIITVMTFALGKLWAFKS